MFYSEYSGRCIGRLLYFLFEYSHRADYCTFGSENKKPMITLYGKPFADYTWDEDTDIPTFTFYPEHEHLEIAQKNHKQELIDRQIERERIKELQEDQGISFMEAVEIINKERSSAKNIGS